MNQPTNSEPTELQTRAMTGPGEVGWSCAAAIRGSDGTPRNSGGGHGLGSGICRDSCDMKC